SGQGGGVTIPFDGDVQPAGLVDLGPASVDRAQGLLDLREAFRPVKFRADELAGFAVCRRADAAVALGLPTFGQPGNLVAAVVRPDGRRVASGQGGLELNSESDLVGVHSVAPGSWCFSRADVASRVTH